MISDYLPVRELQAALQEAQLREVAALVQRGNTETIDPVSDRRFLARIYDAFYGPDRLRRQRKQVLDFVPHAKLRALAQFVGIDDGGSFPELVARLSRPTWGPNDFTRRCLEFFGYPIEYAPTEEDVPGASETVHPHPDPLRSLFDYQSNVAYRSQSALAAPCARAMVQMPTGSGKTRTAMEVVSHYLNGLPDGVVVWLAHTEELCEQAARAFLHVWRHVGKRPVQIQRWWGSLNPQPIEKPAFIVGGFVKLNGLVRKSELSPKADLIVIDEAHRALAPTYETVVNWAKTSSGRVLGLSATPGRAMRDEDENTRLAEYFNEQIIRIDSGELGVIQMLQGRGILAHADREVLDTKRTFHLTREEWAQLEEQFEYPMTFLKRVAQDQERTRLIMERLLEVVRTSERVIVFATSVEQSRLLIALLVYHGVKAAHIDGGTSPATRRASINRFRTGDLRVLSNYEVLSTGFDVPHIDAVFIARPTKSLVLYSQMIGRGMRGVSVGGTAYFRLVDVVDNITDYSSDLDDVHEYFAEYWG